ncbi:OLC1v1035529C1 [Oldenlandia corymbosa var. corymbosa]|uniref:OLC1v1035529C1 n=1 Tax=Oldenlandia corymbosa var. corymbosa TaxID=529605 RepID=A0AAV1CT86_OLDCO|nr:OLC1v1035529C1 [Oldenlandia corymbosa var. corymbosa]
MEKLVKELRFSTNGNLRQYITTVKRLLLQLDSATVVLIGARSAILKVVTTVELLKIQLEFPIAASFSSTLSQDCGFLGLFASGRGLVILSILVSRIANTTGPPQSFSPASTAVLPRRCKWNRRPCRHKRGLSESSSPEPNRYEGADQSWKFRGSKAP